MRMLWAAAAALMLAGCAGSSPPPAGVSARPIPFPTGAGLHAVLGQDANQLTRLFGPPNADVRDGVGRKLQFTSAICVLDAYLYAKGSAAPVVTYLDARETDGSPIDKASCVAALQRRSGGK